VNKWLMHMEVHHHYAGVSYYFLSVLCS